MVLVAIATIISLPDVEENHEPAAAVASMSDLVAREILFVNEHDIYLVLTGGGRVLALSNDAQHLGKGDVVKFCLPSRMFEAETHGEKFDSQGRYFAGPARRGLDRYPVRVEGDQIYVDLDRPIAGPPRNGPPANEPAGDFCVPT